MHLHLASGTVVAGTHWVAPASAVDDRLLREVAGPVLVEVGGRRGPSFP